MQGASGTYAFNGTPLTLQPTEGRWIDRESYGVDGFGHPIYPAVRQFEMTFVLASISDFNQLLLAYNAVAHTGTVVVDLPQYDAQAYVFKSYTGCTLEEPYRDTFFNEYQQNIRLVVMNIRT